MGSQILIFITVPKYYTGLHFNLYFPKYIGKCYFSTISLYNNYMAFTMLQLLLIWLNFTCFCNILQTTVWHPSYFCLWASLWLGFWYLFHCYETSHSKSGVWFFISGFICKIISFTNKLPKCQNLMIIFPYIEIS